MKYVALLRGVNLAGHNRLPMKELAAIFLGAGCRSAVTYIQSGNVVFEADAKCASAVPFTVAKSIQTKFGFGTELIIRSPEEWQTTMDTNPFRTEEDWESRLYVYFLSAKPSEERVLSLDAHRSPPDRFTVRESDIFTYLVNGAGRTKLSNAYFDSKLGVTSTARNWRTVVKLWELLQG